MSAALGLWSQFPVEAAPRPLVLTGPSLQETGYATDQAKRAFDERRVRLAPGVPTAALDALVAEVDRLEPQGSDAVTVMDAVAAPGRFSTDRGVVELGSWRLRVSDALGPVVVLDARERARFWAPTLGQGALRGALGKPVELDGSGTVLRFRFVGVPRSARLCRLRRRRRRRRRRKGAAAVAVAPRVRIKPGGDGWRRAYAERRAVSVRLPLPLGARVLVELRAAPLRSSEAASDAVPGRW